MSQPSLAVIVPTAGRSAQLIDCLASITQSSSAYSDLKIFVVDNNSQESLSRLVKQASEMFPNVEYSYCPSPGLSSARHHLLKTLDSDIFCYVDDDVKFSPSWLDSVTAAFRDSSVAMAGGPSIPDFQGSIPAWLWDFLQPSPYGGWCCPWLSLLDIGHDVDNINPNWIWGLNFAIRRDALLDCGGFHIDLVPKQYIRWQGDGETGLTMKLAAKGYKAVY
ncbi:MAG: glycosyltransferase, partial [Nostocales cyanobacterium ELA608]